MVHSPKSPKGDLDSKWMSQTLRDSAYPLSLDMFIEEAGTDKSIKSNFGFELVRDELLVDVTDTCNFNINTGIQRVVRNLVRELVSSKVPLRLVTWNSNETALRELTENEFKVAAGIDISLGHDPSLGLQDPEEYAKLIPVGCNLFIPELATQTMRVKRSICLGKNTSNQIFAIGYDAVPIVLPDTASNGMVSAFTLQLAMLNHCTTIFGISNATASELDSLFSAVVSQGIRPPKVVSLPLPVASIHEFSTNLSISSEVSRFLVVGSHEPRKNHERIMAASEMLWQEGLHFELHFIGGRGWNSEYFWELYSLLKARGRTIFNHVGITDKELMEMYQSSDALLSFSFHEGYGLPIAEAEATGLSVITAPHGGQGELAKLLSTRVSKGTEIEDIREAMNEFLDEKESQKPTQHSDSRADLHHSTWKDYATEVIKVIAI